MASSKKIKVMLSSRCKDKFPLGNGRELSDIRRQLKTELESELLLGKEYLEVWINEDAPPNEGTEDSWETCMTAARDCDLLIVLYNGNAGWAKNSGDIGICHAELRQGLEKAPGKVRLISLGGIPTDNTTTGVRNQRFQHYVNTQSLFFGGGEVTNEDKLRTRVRQAILDGIIELSRKGVREAGLGRFHSGEALDWSRLDYQQRKEKIEAVLQDCLERDTSAGDSFLKVGATKALFLVHVIPAAITISAAREMVGQPFLKDYKHVARLAGGKVGPVHLIGCHKTVSESQALDFLGFPDATVVDAPFGIYIADDVQRIQLIFLENCRDESSTRHAFQRFREWIAQSGEEEFMATRAASRARILRAIAAELRASASRQPSRT